MSHTDFADRDELPYVIFVCQDRDHCEQFLTAADRELTGHQWHPSARPEDYAYPGRQRVLFAIEPEMHRGQVSAWRVPSVPPGDRARDPEARGVHLPGARERVTGHDAA